MKAITNAWALREVYFDENGEPGMHREPEQAQPVAHTLNCVCGATWDIKADGSEEMVNAPDSNLPRRKPLSDEEIEYLYFDKLNCDFKAFARAIEARSGIKGEA